MDKISKQLIIFGNEKMADLAWHYFSKDSLYTVACFVVDKMYLQEDTRNGLPVYAFDDIEEKFSPDHYEMFIAIGYKNLNKLRTQKCEQARNKGYRLASYVSSKVSTFSDFAFGDNCFILENQVIQPWVKFGNNVVVWSGNHFGHDVVIDDNCWLSSHIVLSGGVHVGTNTFIGVNAAIRDGVKIGSECIIGAGSLILRDAKDKEVYVEKNTPLYALNSEYFERMQSISD